VAVLCARRDSYYKQIVGCDVYDLARGAKTFRGGKPVIAHPPCRLFGRLSQRVAEQEEVITREILLGIWCARMVEKCGGVLEHPAYSALFRIADLPEPGSRGRGGFTIEVPQCWWGHTSVKLTWLFFSGNVEPLPRSPFKFEPDIGGGAGSKGSVARQSHRQREMTPPDFAEWLVTAVEHADQAVLPL